MNKFRDAIIQRNDIPEDIMPLIPDYLARRFDDGTRLRSLLESKSFESIQSVSHKMKGSGTTYGFAVLTELAAELEDAAEQKDERTIGYLLDDYDVIVSRIKAML